MTSTLSGVKVQQILTHEFDRVEFEILHSGQIQFIVSSLTSQDLLEPLLNLFVGKLFVREGLKENENRCTFGITGHEDGDRSGCLRLCGGAQPALPDSSESVEPATEARSTLAIGSGALVRLKTFCTPSSFSTWAVIRRIFSSAAGVYTLSVSRPITARSSLPNSVRISSVVGFVRVITGQEILHREINLEVTGMESKKARYDQEHDQHQPWPRENQSGETRRMIVPHPSSENLTEPYGVIARAKRRERGRCKAAGHNPESQSKSTRVAQCRPKSPCAPLMIRRRLSPPFVKGGSGRFLTRSQEGLLRKRAGSL